jgi:hypothetical protein
MAAIEQASESSALQELASDTTEATATSTDQAACQADDMQELVIVGEELAQQAGQQEPGASGGNMGHASTTNTSGARQVASGTRGQSINSKSGVWSALFFVSDSGAPSMEFKQNGRVPCIVEFESGSDRMRALQQSAKWADEAAMVCTTPPASQAPEQTGAVLNSETPQDQTPGFERVKPFNCDPAAMLTKGIKPEQLVGMGVNYTGNMASPGGDVAGTQGERSANDNSPVAKPNWIKPNGPQLLPKSLEEYTAYPDELLDLITDILGDDAEGFAPNGSLVAVGLRGIPTDSELGKTPRKSWQSVDGEKPYLLSGVSTIGITGDYSYAGHRELFKGLKFAIEYVTGYANRGTGFVSIIAGVNDQSNHAGVANDIGETIIGKPKVIAYIRLNQNEPTPPASHTPENTTGEHHENAK